MIEYDDEYKKVWLNQINKVNVVELNQDLNESNITSRSNSFVVSKGGDSFANQLREGYKNKHEETQFFDAKSQLDVTKNKSEINSF